MTASAVAAPAKAKKPTAPRKPAAHPPTSQLVNKAIADLKERSGSSVQAIKKWIAANHKVDADKLAPFIKKYLKGAVVAGKLVQTKGKGATGSFKLSAAAKAAKVGKKKKPVKAKKPVVKKAKKPVAKKSVAAKKPKTTAAKKPAVAKKPKAAVAKKPKTAVAKKPKTAAVKPKVKKAPAKQKTTKPKAIAKKVKSPKPKKAVAKKTVAGAAKKAKAAPKAK